MQFKLNDYVYGSRLILISEESICATGEFYIPELERSFKVSNEDELFNLVPNDVVYINEYGKVQRIYENRSRSLDLMLTIHCNSNCIMCPISEGARRTNENGYYDWLLELIDVLPENIEHVCITGGEPTLIGEKLFILIDKLTKKLANAEYQFLTNGRSCANLELCKKVINHMPLYTLYGVPLHAHNYILHDKIAQVDGAFNQTVQGIKNLVQNGAHVEVRVVVSKMNATILESLAVFIAQNLQGISCVTFMGIETMGNAIKNYEKIWIDYDVATSFIEKAIDILMGNGIDVMIYNYPLCLISKKYWLLSRRSITEYKVRYYEKCNLCSVKEVCSGIFKSTFNVAKPNVKPVEIPYD